MRARFILGFFWLHRLAAASFGLRRLAAVSFGLRRLAAVSPGLQGLTLAILLGCALAGCHSSNPDTPHILIQTQAGDIEVELYPKQAPKTAGAFLSYVDSGFYKNSNFYRVLNDDN